VTPLYPQKLAITSPTGGGRSVGIVRVRTEATEFSFRYLYYNITLNIPTRFDPRQITVRESRHFNCRIHTLDAGLLARSK